MKKIYRFLLIGCVLLGCLILPTSAENHAPFRMEDAAALGERWAALPQETKNEIYAAKEALITAETALLQKYRDSGILPAEFADSLIAAERAQFDENRKNGTIPDFCRPCRPAR